MDESLSIDQIAARFRELPGAKLVGWQNVALPIFLLKLRIVIVDRQPISVIDEFILRSIASGVGNNLDLAKFLGLDFKTVDGHLAELHKGELVTAPGGSKDTKISVALTPRGMAACVELSTKVVEEQVVKIFVHGIGRQPIPFRTTELLSSSDCEESELPMIPPVPSNRPSLDEISVDAVAAILKPFWKKQGRSAELIAIKGVEREAGLRFESGIMLEYRGSGGEARPQYSFIVNGERKVAYDEQFAKRGGAKKIPSIVSFNRALSERDLTKAFLDSGLPPPEEEVNRAIEAEVKRFELEEKLRVEQLETVIVASEPDTRQRQAARIAELEAELTKAEEVRNTLPVAILRTNDCDKALHKAISDACKRLIIVSGTVSMNAINSLLPELESALSDRGIEVWIGYGMNKNTQQGQKHRANSGFDDCVKTLHDLRKRWKDKVKIEDWGNSHSKILICDEQYMIVGSYNWLSHKPIGMKSMKEHAVKVTAADSILALVKECEGQFLRKR